MPQQEFEMARASTVRHLAANGILHHMFCCPPASYWEQETKILMVNLEAVGYQDCGMVQVDEGVLNGWVFHNKSKRSRTAAMTFVFAIGVAEAIRGMCNVSAAQLKDIRRDDDRIKNAIQEVAYMNINPESNAHIPENATKIRAVGGTALGTLLSAEIRALDPDILVVSGHSGRIAIGQCLGTTPSYRSSIQTECCILTSVKHHSRTGYAEMSQALAGVVELVGKQRSTISP